MPARLYPDVAWLQFERQRILIVAPIDATRSPMAEEVERQWRKTVRLPSSLARSSATPRAGRLWAILYSREEIVAREEVQSLPQGRRRVTDMVLAAADAASVPASIPVQGRRSLLRRVQDTSPRKPEELRRRNPWRPATAR